MQNLHAQKCSVKEFLTVKIFKKIKGAWCSALEAKVLTL